MPILRIMCTDIQQVRMTRFLSHKKIKHTYRILQLYCPKQLRVHRSSIKTYNTKNTHTTIVPYMKQKTCLNPSHTPHYSHQTSTHHFSHNANETYPPKPKGLHFLRRFRILPGLYPPMLNYFYTYTLKNIFSDI